MRNKAEKRGGEGIEAYLKEIAPLVNEEIEKIFPRALGKEWLETALGKADFAYDKETITKSMAKPIWEFLDRGGKRWRPALTVLACEAAGGNRSKALLFTPLIELVHEGTIAVDDLEDNSPMRRGKPSMHHMWGTDIAVNDANAMYFIPLILLYKNPYKLDDQTLRRVWDLYGQELLRVSIGQAMDIYWHHGHKNDVSENEYLQMCSYKTGVLARFACRLGAILANATQKQTETLGKFGETIGIAFQIQDDILNLVGEEFQKGKGIGEDIHEGKRTLMVIHCLRVAPEAERKRLLEILNSHPEDQGSIAEAIQLLEKNGSMEYAEKKARQLVKEAWKKLESELKESNAKQLLKAFADYLVERKI